MPEQVHRLACKRCQTRKIKCNRIRPCTNCAHGSHACEFPASDARKRPVSHKYLGALEARLAYFETLTQKLKGATAEERNELLENTDLNDHLQSWNDPPVPTDQASPVVSEDSTGSHAIALRSGPLGILQFHGPTSIYLDVDTRKSSKPQDNPLANDSRSSPPVLDSFSIVRLASTLGVDESLVQETLSLFFLNQYPLCMFIYREAFVSDYYANTYGGRYWSFALLYAMCALGAPHSSNVQIQEKKHLLAKCAQEIVISQCLTKPSITTLQALLCLAFHEVGQGNASQGWLFSGMAIRMGHDLGFHQDPVSWVSHDRSIVTPEDVEIRRRVYWGTYVADKIISLYLGRPVYLREDDATVHPSEALPDFPSDHAWFGLSEIASHFASNEPHKQQLVLALKHKVHLGKIFQDIMSDIFSQPRTKRRSEASRSSRLGELNLSLTKWQTALPESLQWSQWSTSKASDSHVLVLHLFYHSLLLSLNRYFVKPIPGFPPSATSREICLSSCATITVLIRQFRSQHGLRSAPLMLVYSLVMATITQIHTLEQHPDTVGFFSRALDECARCYKLAAEVKARLFPNHRPQTSQQAETDLDMASSSAPEPASHATASHMATEAISVDAIPEAFAQENVFDDTIMDMNVFDIPDLGDMAGDFQGWFSVGQMG